jgi:glycosyltransferase involved in cell wall biosynthesis/putative flippase GtrA
MGDALNRSAPKSPASPARPLRICILYDCLFPYTVGGAERWCRNLAERLAGDGAQVTYLTLRQWDEGDEGRVPGVTVKAVGPRMALYGADGARRIAPPLRFGLGVLLHLARHGRSYDVVHTASFPFFSVLAAGLLRPLFGYRLVVDWHEFWPRAYWRGYLGAMKGEVGWAVQALCARLPQRAYCFARLTAARLEAHGVNGPLSILEGEYEGPLEAREPRPAEPYVVFAGRHIPEKRATAVIPAVVEARRTIPGLAAHIFGTGPDSARIAADNAAAGAPAVLHGHAPSELVDETLSRALCLVLPSSREGYGLVVVEAASRGVPAIVVRGEDNAAVELVEEGVNGFVADSASPADLAQAIIKVHAAGPALRRSTADWFGRNARRLSLASSLETVAANYRRPEPTTSLGDQGLRYALVSAGCLALHNLIVIGGAALGLHYAAGMLVSFAVLVCLGYLAHVHFTFRTRAEARSFALYAGACAVNLPIAMATIYGFCSLLRLPVAIGAPATSVVMFVFNFLAARLAIGPRLPWGRA